VSCQSGGSLEATAGGSVAVGKVEGGVPVIVAEGCAAVYVGEGAGGAAVLVWVAVGASVSIRLTWVEIKSGVAVESGGADGILQEDSRKQMRKSESVLAMEDASLLFYQPGCPGLLLFQPACIRKIDGCIIAFFVTLHKVEVSGS
jgi:hypothetical protein